VKILILGASGMIGRAMFQTISLNKEWDVVGTTRSRSPLKQESLPLRMGVDLLDPDGVSALFKEEHPDIVINCAGLTKHLLEGSDPIAAIKSNALLPHRIADQCAIVNARLIHISTDCVYSGLTGNYRETDISDPQDLYGKTKVLGEVVGSNQVTLRTSTIGHEGSTCFGLLEWFLSQSSCVGYVNAIFSGVTTIELARVVKDFVIPNKNLEGLYHVSADAIDKYSLLRLLADIYKLHIPIVKNGDLKINRSLNSDLFRKATGYKAPSWPAMINVMYKGWLEGMANVPK
jgi:dTDP-4-dehydrorhamnose reductase